MKVIKNESYKKHCNTKIQKKRFLHKNHSKIKIITHKTKNGFNKNFKLFFLTIGEFGLVFYDFLSLNLVILTELDR